MNWLNRTSLLLGEEKLEILSKKHILIVGVGGVGAYAAEMLVRAGIGHLTIVDGDHIEETNINRQLPALHSTIGKEKVKVLKERFLDINPELDLTCIYDYMKDEKIIELVKGQYDYVLDAIDTLAPKVFLIYYAVKANHKVISSMGAGGKFNPELIKTADISKSYNCKLARMLRKRLNKLGLRKGVKVVFSPEEVSENAIRIEEGQNKKSVVGTISYMPASFGIHMAASVIQDLINE